MGVVGYGLGDGFSETRTNSMRDQQTHQGRWVKISGLPKFGTTNSHNMYVAAAVWKVSKKRTQATRRHAVYQETIHFHRSSITAFAMTHKSGVF